MRLSEYDISSLIQKLEGFEETFNSTAYDIVNKLVDIGGEQAIKFNSIAPKSGTEDNVVLKEGAKIEGSKVTGSVVLYGPNAVFDEFGTGEEGRDNPHPLAGKIRFTMPPYSGYVTGPYVSTHINPDNGRHYWIYKPNGSLPSYQDDGYTEGIPSGKQMYNTLQSIRDAKKSVIRECTKETIKEINKVLTTFK